MQPTLPDLATVKDIAAEAKNFSEVTVRDLIYHAQPRLSATGEEIPPNGFASCVVRIGHRVLIDRQAIRLWLESKRLAPLSELSRRGAAAGRFGLFAQGKVPRTDGTSEADEPEAAA